ncbi:predicted protein [Thalassiosira pseudonana CCMP1335]|jgi:pimeloyl-ACP methyl ester carboxylesterase|uniref:AB hydrolase-1 domain-containing protein n=1 Tax=Thalassiosira pseudonana TaxID=35128 RepID=B8BRA9_THAPS|nr:predicted protein [Thalassiosira pseudonana CCMP1335]EED95930.1 predicted protein [Thalassiosira pseudonana CCMP1335]|eukprot:scaffold2178_cov171-Alexandrium_tamarense.AAC.4
MLTTHHLLVLAYIISHVHCALSTSALATPISGYAGRCGDTSSRQPLCRLRCHQKRKASTTKLYNSSDRTSQSVREEIRYIAGRRALLLHPPVLTSKPEYRPPLVVLGGMAQSISSWEFHLPHLCKDRSVLVYEALGQGPPPPTEVCSVDGKEVTLDQYYDDVSLERQGRDFWEVIQEAFFDDDSYHYQHYISGQADGNDIVKNKKVDVAGFSFGGRVAMAAATLKPNGVRRLHLSGVGAERDAYASVVLASWKDMLGAGSSDGEVCEGSDDMNNDEECDPESHSSRCTTRLRAFAWSIILATYAERFLASAGPVRVQSWVDSVCRYNTEEGLRSLLMQTHGSFLDDNDETSTDQDKWTPTAMALRIHKSQAVESCRIVVGSEDKMSAPNQALKLAELLGYEEDQSGGTNCYYKVIPGHGHAVLMEAMRAWREDVLGFLNE